MKPTENIEKKLRLKQFLIHIYGIKEGIYKYRNMMRGGSLKVLCFKFGSIEGKKEYERRSNIRKCTKNLDYFINKHGDIIGPKKYELFRENMSIHGTLEKYIRKYGEIDGPKKYKEKNSKLSVGRDSLKLRGFTDKEIEEIKNIHSSKSSLSLKSYIEKFGETIGQIKYNEMLETRVSPWTKKYWINKGFSEIIAIDKISKLQTRDLYWFINKYKDITIAKQKYAKYNKSKGLSKDDFIKKHGEKHYNECVDKKRITYDYLIKTFGIEKGNDIQQRKLHKFNGSSKLQKKFCNELYNILDKHMIDCFYGEPISNSFYINLTQKERCMLNQKIIIPDIKINNYIIEFDGTYWHSFTVQKDNLKDIIYKQRGYNIIRIPEADYIKNGTQIIQNLKKIIENENK